MQNVVPIQSIEPVRAREYSGQQLDLIRRTVAKDTNPDEFDLFIEVARRTGLDPFRRQIYAFVFSKGNEKKRRLAIVTGIDGYRVIAQRSGNYRPADKSPLIEFADDAKSDTNPRGIVRAEVIAYQRGGDGEWYPVVGEAYWEEFAPIKELWEYDKERGKDAPSGKFRLAKDNWKTMPRVMIAKCAEAQALRRGWPEELSGVYSEEELHRAQVDDASASAMVEQHQSDVRLKQISASDGITFLWAAGDPLEAVPLGEIADRCMAFIQGAGSPTQLETWREINRVALQEFWARQKSDALEVKKALEARIAELAKPMDAELVDEPPHDATPNPLDTLPALDRSKELTE